MSGSARAVDEDGATESRKTSISAGPSMPSQEALTSAQRPRDRETPLLLTYQQELKPNV